MHERLQTGRPVGVVVSYYMISQYGADPIMTEVPGVKRRVSRFSWDGASLMTMNLVEMPASAARHGCGECKAQVFLVATGVHGMVPVDAAVRGGLRPIDDHPGRGALHKCSRRGKSGRGWRLPPSEDIAMQDLEAVTLGHEYVRLNSSGVA